jgi:hypothetical protein
MNLIDPLAVGPHTAAGRVGELLRAAGTSIDRAELVGLLPEIVLRATPRSSWAALDLAEDRTIEARLARRATT